MTWPELMQSPPPLSMTGVLAFMERWAPGSTRGFVPATAEQIEALGRAHGRVGTLPLVYRDFLAVMGQSTGRLRLKAGTTSILALLDDLADRSTPSPDPRRYFKFALGEEGAEERGPDDFFDLARPTADGRDAAVIRIREDLLTKGLSAPAQPFPTFSDWLRSVIISRVVFEVEPAKQTQYCNLGANPEAPSRAYAFFLRAGFSLTEFGASPAFVPLEHRGRGAVALIRAPSASVPRAAVEVRAHDKTQQQSLAELIADHRDSLRGG